VLILEIARPRSRLALALTRWYFRTAVPWITRLGTGSPDAERLTRYYWDTIAECAPPERVVQALSAGGFREVRRRVFAGILNEYEGTRP
jgi:demethylmenaquinone methyltransferase/2-methoxy-6-polyprenyl-1,4-benzoquinol methylase